MSSAPATRLAEASPDIGADSLALSRHLICPFVSDSREDETVFPQMTGRSSSVSFKNVYWQCMVVLFASFRRFDRTAACSIVTNADPASYCEPSILRRLDELRVEISIVPFTRKLQVATGRFGNVLYLFDVLDALQARSDRSNVLLLDPDCVFARDPEPIWSDITAQGFLYYDVGTPPEAEIAGLSLALLGQFAARSGLPVERPLTHAGGEFLGLHPAALARLTETVDAIMAAPGGAQLTVEEHVLSLAVGMHAFGDQTANAYLRRIWTGPRRRDARPEDRDLILWHLPREKEFGFARLYRELASCTGPRCWTALPERAYADHLAERLGVPRWSAAKWTREAPRLLTRALRR